MTSTNSNSYLLSFSNTNMVSSMSENDTYLNTNEISTENTSEVTEYISEKIKYKTNNQNNTIINTLQSSLINNDKEENKKEPSNKELPNEVLLKIFSYINDPKDLLTLRCINSNFKLLCETKLYNVINSIIKGLEEKKKSSERRFNHMKNHLCPRLSHYKVFLNVITRSDVSEICNLPKPPKEVKYIFSVLYILYTGGKNCYCSQCCLNKNKNNIFYRHSNCSIKNTHSKKGSGSNAYSTIHRNDLTNYEFGSNTANQYTTPQQKRKSSSVYNGSQASSQYSSQYSSRRNSNSSSSSYNSSRRGSSSSTSSTSSSSDNLDLCSLPLGISKQNRSTSISSEKSKVSKHSMSTSTSTSNSISNSSSTSTSPILTKSPKNKYLNSNNEENIEIPSWEEVRQVINKNDFRNWIMNLRSRIEEVPKEHIQMANTLLNRPRASNQAYYRSATYSHQNSSSSSSTTTSSNSSSRRSTHSSPSSSSSLSSSSTSPSEYENLILTYDRMLIVSQIGYKILLFIEAIIQYSFLSKRFDEQKESLSYVHHQIFQWKHLQSQCHA